MKVRELMYELLKCNMEDEVIMECLSNPNHKFSYEYVEDVIIKPNAHVVISSERGY